MRMRNGHGGNPAKVLHSISRRIIDERYTVPKEVALSGLNQQCALANCEFGRSAKTSDAASLSFDEIFVGALQLFGSTPNPGHSSSRIGVHPHKSDNPLAV